MDFIVTEKAMRPAGPERRCFYCKEPIGGKHGPTCVLVRKKVKIRATVEYEIEVPAHWDAEDIEFHRNDGSWCSSNMIGELEALGCLCGAVHFEHLADCDAPPYLGEG